MSMRAKFTTPGTSIYYYDVEWEGDLTWEEFRGSVLGPTDPAEAPADSLRGLIAADWEALGLQAPCNVGDNGVHASASPFEALAERMNWLGADLASDPLGAAMLDLDIPEQMIEDWSVDPQVLQCSTGTKGSLFDALEDTDIDECLLLMNEIAAYAKIPLDRNQAFVFIKVRGSAKRRAG